MHPSLFTKASDFLPTHKCVGAVCAGLGRVEAGKTEPDCLDNIRLDWTSPDWTRCLLNWTALALRKMGTNRIGLDWVNTGLAFRVLDGTQMDWTECELDGTPLS